MSESHLTGTSVSPLFENVQRDCERGLHRGSLSKGTKSRDWDSSRSIGVCVCVCEHDFLFCSEADDIFTPAGTF